MKLKKMITVSAAALMLLGVSASTTNVNASGHASHQTVRLSRLYSQKNSLTRQLKKVNGEIAHLNKRSVKKGKRSKKSVKRSKKAKKGVKRNARRNKQAKTVKNSPSVNKATSKLTPQQQQALSTQIAAAKNQRTTRRLVINDKVYNAEVNGIGEILSKKPYMSTKAYVKKYGHVINKLARSLNSMIKPVKGNQAKLQKLSSNKKFKTMYAKYNALMPVKLVSKPTTSK